MIKLNDQEFHYLVEYVKNNFGIDLTRKRVLLEGRLNNYLVDQGFLSYSDFIKALEGDQTGKELINLVNKVTTNHTFFMREPEHFEFLRRTVLPQLERGVRDRDLRIWCAAASTGEEPYTLAMLLNDYFGSKMPRWDKTLLATDLSTKVLEQARRGIYTTEAVGSLPEAWQRQYFSSLDDEHVRVVPAIRRDVVFRQFNLMDTIVAKRPYQVVFCRNVMIYFDTPTKAQLVERLYEAMCPGGYLFIGYTESLPKPTRFQYIRPSVYQKGV